MNRLVSVMGTWSTRDWVVVVEIQHDAWEVCEATKGNVGVDTMQLV